MSKLFFPISFRKFSHVLLLVFSQLVVAGQPNFSLEVNINYVEEDLPEDLHKIGAFIVGCKARVSSGMHNTLHFNMIFGC